MLRARSTLFTQLEKENKSKQYFNVLDFREGINEEKKKETQMICVQNMLFSFRLSNQLGIYPNAFIAIVWLYASMFVSDVVFFIISKACKIFKINSMRSYIFIELPFWAEKMYIVFFMIGNWTK